MLASAIHKAIGGYRHPKKRHNISPVLAPQFYVSDGVAMHGHDTGVFFNVIVKGLVIAFSLWRAWLSTGAETATGVDVIFNVFVLELLMSLVKLVLIYAVFKQDILQVKIFC